jgi:hypothetical protein
VDSKMPMMGFCAEAVSVERRSRRVRARGFM